MVVTTKQGQRIEDSESYRNFLRISIESFDALHMLVKHSIMKKNTNMRESISSEKRLALTLRFLATGESYRCLMYATRIHESTISIIIPEEVDSMYAHLKAKYLKMPTTVAEWQLIAHKFERMWNFPICLGAIDGKHIKFQPLRSTGSYYYSYKSDHSIVLLGFMDAEYKFLFVNVGVNGRISDGGVFRQSGLKEMIDNDVLNFPSAVCLPGQSAALPYTFVADEAFALGTRLMKPYGSGHLDNDSRIDNYHLSRARRVVQMH